MALIGRQLQVRLVHPAHQRMVVGVQREHGVALVHLARRLDKRSVTPIERGDVDQWLAGTVEDAQQLLKLATVEVFAAGPIAA
jgi:hypothetical protein